MTVNCDWAAGILHILIKLFSPADKGWQDTKFMYSMYSANYYRDGPIGEWEKGRR